jgi:quinol monooxygenase YgiN
VEEAITIVAHLTAKAGMQDLLHEELLRIVALSRTEIGCLYYDLYRSADDEREFFIIETWNGSDAFENHSHSPHGIRLQALPNEWLREPLRRSRLALLV